ncbi:hypothetical protein B0T25DRAFT_543661 [Lasiosphaeria hispida]|uniref:Uncharacterized protein n=1 Tax=Lasiosphaeria hispida TaxID=260671 RepID=A0AAJ0HI76_9PEZI|nr:hypothetical protein B0T25DRAFT_543661 [Lasiosphaeria hispida]
MQKIGHQDDKSCISLGKRRGISDLARFALDLTWARADSESAARLGSYPSPPMSGSPPLPPKASQEAAERSQGTYQATTQDVYRGSLTTKGDDRVQTLVQVPPTHFPSETPERTPFPFQRSDGPMTRPSSLPYPQQHGSLGPQPSYLPIPGAGGPGALGGPGTIAGTLPALHTYMDSQRRAQNPQRPPSPKPQRKTKGHVASACVPCKRAHLRFVYPSRPSQRLSSAIANHWQMRWYVLQPTLASHFVAL